MPTYAEWVSTAALERPRLVLRTYQTLGFGHRNDPVTITFTMQVINYGGRPGTVTDLGWRREAEPDGTYSIRRSLAEPQLRAVHGPHINGPVIPCRIEPNDQAAWEIAEPYMERWQGERLQPVLEWLQPLAPRWRRLWRKEARSGEVSGDWMEVPAFGLTTRDYLASQADDPA